MADEQITSNTANIPWVNLINVGSDQAAPAAGRAILYIKNGVLYVRLDSGDPVPVGGAVTLAQGQLAVGNGSDVLSALALGTPGDVVTADASGYASWATPAAPPAGGDLVKLDTVTVGTGGQATVDFTSIDQTYTSLLVEYMARGDAATWGTDLRARINADSNAIYDYHVHGNYGSGTFVEGAQSQTSFRCYWAEASTGPSGFFSTGRMQLPFYARTVNHKELEFTSCCRVTDTTLANLYHGTGYGSWRSTAAINQLTFYPPSGGFVEGTTFVLYGLK